MPKQFPFLEKVNLKKTTNTLQLNYSDGTIYDLEAEFLRVFSPSAETREHGKIEYGKIHVSITNIELVGNYALRLIFSDGHNTGLYTWEYVHDLSCNKIPYWQSYLKSLKTLGLSRDPQTSVITLS